MTVEGLATYVCSRYRDLNTQRTWGELAFFVNPGALLTRGVYFCTIKEKDGENDRASNLDRDGIYRFNFKMSAEDYKAVLGERPGRPGKGKVVSGSWDFLKADTLTPHPVYGWMHWVSILNPTPGSLKKYASSLDTCYERACDDFAKRVRKL